MLFMTNIQRIEKSIGYVFRDLPEGDLLRLEVFLRDHHILKKLISSKYPLFSHSLGVSKKALELLERYAESIEIDRLGYIRDITVLAGFLHDVGKVAFDKTGSYTIHDSLNLEIALRKYKLSCIAQAIRNNPYLFLFDFRNGNLSVPQLIVAQADTMVAGDGAEISREDRLTDVIKRKNINIKFQRYYWDLLQQLVNARSVRTINPHLRFGFVERCDGKYRIENNSATLSTLSSFHIAKELVNMGFYPTVVGDTSRKFVSEGVEFVPAGNDPTYVYNIIRKQDFVYVTGWEILFNYLRENNNCLPLLVLRSLQQKSIFGDRALQIYRNMDRLIMVSQSSSEYLLGLLRERLENKYKQNAKPIVIQNGINKSVFCYREKRIKKQFVFVGAPNKEKGIFEVFKLAKLLPDYSCLVVGESSMYGRDRKDELKTGEESVPTNVVFLGQQPHSQIVEYFLESMFSVGFTNKELIFETFGKALVESQMCGCPVIYLNNGGFIENSIKCRTNLGFDVFDEFDIAKKIRSRENIMRNHKYRKLLAKKADSQFMDWKDTACRYVATSYTKLMESLSKRLLDQESIVSYLFSS